MGVSELLSLAIATNAHVSEINLLLLFFFIFFGGFGPPLN